MTDVPVTGDPAPAASRRLPPWLGAGAFYVALTVAYAWALLPVLASALPSDAGDPALNAWILWWNTQAVPFTERWWNAPIFFPVPGTFALSETLLSLVPLTTPLQWAGTGPVAAYNVAFLLSFPASALAAHALAHRLTGRHDAALLAGLAYGFNPYRAAHLAHLQVLWSCWMPLCLLALHGYLQSRQRRFLVLAGLCWVLNGLTSGYFLVYFGVLAGLWVLWFARSWRDWLSVGGTLALASLALAPLLAGYAERQAALGLTRNPGEVGQFSADVSAIWATRHVWLPAHWTLRPAGEGELYPGAIALTLVVVGAVVAWRRAGAVKWSRWRIAAAVAAAYLAEAVAITLLLGPWHVTLFDWRLSMTGAAKPLFLAACLLAGALIVDPRLRAAWRRRSVLLFYAGAAAVMFLFALGPVARAFGEGFWPRAPYFWLMELPGGLALRVPARFAMLLVLGLSQAAALAFARLTPHGARAALVAALALGVAAEGWVLPLPTAAMDQRLAPLPARADETLLELPVHDTLGETAAMFRSIGHGFPLVNGFSGYMPPHYFALREALGAHDPAALDGLREFGALLVLVHHGRDPDGRVERFVRERPGSEFVMGSSVGPLYRLPRREAPPATGELLSVAGVRADSQPEQAALMLDGRWDTRWQSAGRLREATIDVRLGAPADIARVELDLGQSAHDYPRRLRVEVGGSAGSPETVWEGPASGLAALAILRHPLRMPLTVPLAGGRTGERVVVTLIADGGVRTWTVTELRVFGRPSP